jgi:hypothetical protein
MAGAFVFNALAVMGVGKSFKKTEWVVVFNDRKTAHAPTN